MVDNRQNYLIKRVEKYRNNLVVIYNGVIAQLNTYRANMQSCIWRIQPPGTPSLCSQVHLALIFSQSPALCMPSSMTHLINLVAKPYFKQLHLNCWFPSSTLQNGLPEMFEWKKFWKIMKTFVETGRLQKYFISIIFTCKASGHHLNRIPPKNHTSASYMHYVWSPHLFY